MARIAAKFSLTPEQQKLVTDNLNLARREAWRYQRKTDIDYKTLESVAFEGLCQAAYKYDPSMINVRNGLPMKFSSIAVPYTRGAILHYIRDKTYLLRLSHKMRETWLKGRRLVFEGKSDIEIAETLGIDLLDWLDCRVTCSGPPLELQEQGAPTVDPAIEEPDMRQKYLDQAAQAFTMLPLEDQRRLVNYFTSSSSRSSQEALGAVMGILSDLGCLEASYVLE
jgi:RNA polymerase sigma-B factor